VICPIGKINMVVPAKRSVISGTNAIAFVPEMTVELSRRKTAPLSDFRPAKCRRLLDRLDLIVTEHPDVRRRR
jgi:hypothetical protein